MAGTPSPAVLPEGWRSCVIGSYRLPPDIADGAAVVKVSDDKLDVDNKTSAGKDKAKTTVHGVSAIKMSIDVKCTVKSWAALEATLEALDPNGPNRGKPYDWDALVTRFRKVKKVIVTEIGDLVQKGHTFAVTISVIEWVPPAAASVSGGTKTPNKSLTWNTASGTIESISGLNAPLASASGTVSPQAKAYTPSNPSAPTADP